MLREKHKCKMGSKGMWSCVCVGPSMFRGSARSAQPGVRRGSECGNGQQIDVSQAHAEVQAWGVGLGPGGRKSRQRRPLELST